MSRRRVACQRAGIPLYVTKEQRGQCVPPGPSEVHTYGQKLGQEDQLLQHHQSTEIIPFTSDSNSQGSHTYLPLFSIGKPRSLQKASRGCEAWRQHSQPGSEQHWCPPTSASLISHKVAQRRGDCWDPPIQAYLEVDQQM